MGTKTDPLLRLAFGATATDDPDDLATARKATHDQVIADLGSDRRSGVSWTSCAAKDAPPSGGPVMTPTADDYRDAVANGAALLDARVPGWRDRVDVLTLRLSSCERCTLGQLFGGYLDGLRYLALEPAVGDDERRAALYGFTLPDGTHTTDRWDALRDAWIKEIQR